jgi:hypothetical protein
MVLSGFRLLTAANMIRWPDRYMDERGRAMWDRVIAFLPEAGGIDGSALRPIPEPAIIDSPGAGFQSVPC